MIVQNQFKLDPFEKALFVFCNKQMNKIKILHFDEGFWLYYHRLEANRFKWPITTKANKLVVERYLVYLFDNLSKIDLSDSESLENLMPWSNKIPENMHIRKA